MLLQHCCNRVQGNFSGHILYIKGSGIPKSLEILKPVLFLRYFSNFRAIMTFFPRLISVTFSNLNVILLHFAMRSILKEFMGFSFGYVAFYYWLQLKSGPNCPKTSPKSPKSFKLFLLSIQSRRTSVLELLVHCECFREKLSEQFIGKNSAQFPFSHCGRKSLNFCGSYKIN